MGGEKLKGWVGWRASVEECADTIRETESADSRVGSCKESTIESCVCMLYCYRQ